MSSQTLEGSGNPTIVQDDTVAQAAPADKPKAKDLNRRRSVVVNAPAHDSEESEASRLMKYILLFCIQETMNVNLVSLQGAGCYQDRSFDVRKRRF